MESSPSLFSYRSAGFSLVELLIAITLSLFLTLAMMNFFISHKATHQAHSALSQLQENARYLNSYLSQEVRLSGFLGCSVEPGSWRTAVEKIGDPWDYDTYPLGISGHRFDASGQVWQPEIGLSKHLPLNVTNAHPNSDVLVVRRVDTQTLSLTPGQIAPLPGSPPVAAVAPAIARSIQIDKPSGALLVFNTCRDRAVLFSVCRITGSNRHRQLHFSGGGDCQPKNAIHSALFSELRELFDTSSGELGRLQMRAYYLNKNHELIEAHFSDSGEYDTQPLVSGVESFHVSFMEQEWLAHENDHPSQDANSDSSSNLPSASAEVHYFFRAPAEVQRWDQITAVRLDLVLSDPELKPPLKRAVSWVVHLRNNGATNEAL